MIVILWYFFLGIIVSFFYPVIEEMVSIVLTGLEIIKGYLTLKITKINCQLVELKKSMKADDIEESTFAIGFQVPNDDYEEEDDEDV